MRKSTSMLWSAAALACTLALAGCTVNINTNSQAPASRTPSAAPTTAPAGKDLVTAQLATIKTALAAYQADNDGTLPIDVDYHALSNYGYKPDYTNVRIASYLTNTDVTPNTFCLVGGSEANGYFKISTNTAAIEADRCPSDSSTW